jgi:hypothetical protein
LRQRCGGRWPSPRKIDLERSRLAKRSGANLRGEVAVPAAVNRRWSSGRWTGELHPACTPARRRRREQFGAAERSRSARRKLVVPTAAEAPEELGETGGCCELLRRGDQDLQVWVVARTVPGPML